MEYNFTKRERDFGKTVFAITLDRKKNDGAYRHWRNERNAPPFRR